MHDIVGRETYVGVEQVKGHQDSECCLLPTVKSKAQMLDVEHTF